MQETIISVDFDQAAENARLISAHIEDLPSAAVSSHHEGTAVGVTGEFHAALQATALQLPATVERLRSLLQSSQEAIEKTVADLISRDASMADEANAMLAGIADIAGPSSSPASSSTPAPSAPVTPVPDNGGW
jgi:hypothetical protein